MKYILLMSGTKTGVDTYHTWSQKDAEAHMAVFGGIASDLPESSWQHRNWPDRLKLNLFVVRKTECQSPTVFSPSLKSFCWATGSLMWRPQRALRHCRGAFRL